MNLLVLNYLCTGTPVNSEPSISDFGIKRLMLGNAEVSQGAPENLAKLPNMSSVAKTFLGNCQKLGKMAEFYDVSLMFFSVTPRKINSMAEFFKLSWNFFMKNLQNLPKSET